MQICRKSVGHEILFEKMHLPAGWRVVQRIALGPKFSSPDLCSGLFTVEYQAMWPLLFSCYPYLIGNTRLPIVAKMLNEKLCNAIFSWLEGHQVQPVCMKTTWFRSTGLELGKGKGVFFGKEMDTNWFMYPHKCILLYWGAQVNCVYHLAPSVLHKLQSPGCSFWNFRLCLDSLIF